jgi:hypothetical protein
MGPGGGPDNLRPSQPDSLGSDLGYPVRLPGATSTPAGAIALDVSGDQNIAPGTSAILLTVPVADNLRLRLAGIGFESDDAGALGFLTWSILLSGDPAPSGYNNQTAAVGSIRQLSEMFLLVGSSQTVTIQGSSASTAAVTYRFICRLRGWFFAEKGNG